MLGEPLGRGLPHLVGAPAGVSRIVTAFDFQKTFGLASPGGERDRDRLLDAALDELGA